MSDETAKMARLMRVTDAVIAELDRQGVAEAMATFRFDPIQMAQAVIRAADAPLLTEPESQPMSEIGHSKTEVFLFERHVRSTPNSRGRPTTAACICQSATSRTVETDLHHVLIQPSFVAGEITADQGDP